MTGGLVERLQRVGQRRRLAVDGLLDVLAGGQQRLEGSVVDGLREALTLADLGEAPTP